MTGFSCNVLHTSENVVVKLGLAGTLTASKCGKVAKQSTANIWNVFFWLVL